MPIWRRLLYAVCGLPIVLVSALGLNANYSTYSLYFRKRAFLNQVFALDHGVTQLVLVVSGVGFYLLASAAQGARLFSRRWVVSATAAVILAWLLVGGIAIARGYIWPEPPLPRGVPPVEYD